MPRLGLLFVFSAAFLCSPLYAQNSCSGVSLGRGASLNGFIPFPTDNAWNQDISSASVDPNSDALINFIGASTPMHPDFGAGLYAGSTIGIPYIVVSGSPFVNIHFTAYGSESDPGPMPVPHNAPIEGYPHPGNGDRHVLVLDRDNCWLYELYHSYAQKDGSWQGVGHMARFGEEEGGRFGGGGREEGERGWGTRVILHHHPGGEWGVVGGGVVRVWGVGLGIEKEWGWGVSIIVSGSGVCVGGVAREWEGRVMSLRGRVRVVVRIVGRGGRVWNLA